MRASAKPSRFSEASMPCIRLSHRHGHLQRQGRFPFQPFAPVGHPVPRHASMALLTRLCANFAFDDALAEKFDRP
jgi:hypothetical protein